MSSGKDLKRYYYNDLERLIRFLTPRGNKTLKITSENFLFNKAKKSDYDYVVLNNVVGEFEDVQKSLQRVYSITPPNVRLVITYFNHLWEPLLNLATFLGWRKNTGLLNWLDNRDLENLLELEGFDVVSEQNRLLIPVRIPILSDLVNTWIAPLPLVNSLCLTTCLVARKKPLQRKDYSVSIVIPARNEEGNISRAIKSIPRFGSRQELIFVEGHSKDQTWEVIQKEIAKKHRITVSAYQQKGKGKADAVRLGFEKAKGELLMILDADLTVTPQDLPKFYEAIAQGKGEFINGSRLVYPMEKQAMQTLNKLGNKMFGWLFTWILGQRFKDTLCGTKVLLKSHYQAIVKNRSFFGDFDPFGDFDLIFGAVKLNLKVVEVPVRYRERTYGSTNISRFKHGWLLIKMVVFAARKFKVW